MNPLLILVLVLAGLWAALNLVQGISRIDTTLPSVPPVGMTVQAQSTPDNYGLDLYITLTSETGREIGAAGKVMVQIYDEPYGKPERVLRGEEFTVSASDFTKGTQGMGAFKRDAVFAHLGRVNTQVLGKPGDRVSVRASFSTADGTVKLSAKESASLP